MRRLLTVHFDPLSCKVRVSAVVTQQEWDEWFIPPEVVQIASGLGYFRYSGGSGENLTMTWMFER